MYTKYGAHNTSFSGPVFDYKHSLVAASATVGPSGWTEGGIVCVLMIPKKFVVCGCIKCQYQKGASENLIDNRKEKNQSTILEKSQANVAPLFWYPLTTGHNKKGENMDEFRKQISVRVYSCPMELL